MTRNQVRWATVAVLIAVSCVVFLMLAGCGGGVSRAPAAVSDTPTVSLGGYTFQSNSNTCTHRLFTVNPTSPTWVGKGYGSKAGQQMTCTFAGGGLVKNVKTLKWGVTIPGFSPMTFWLAQDSQGNIHYLKANDDPFSGPYLTGVAAANPAWFFLRRAASIVSGATWYEVRDGVKRKQVKITSTNATLRSVGGLTSLREITDDNDDGGFDPSWTGPDNRHDLYFKPSIHGLQGCVLSSSGGFTR